jgi:ubiquinone/menaquinone biosynthesis C-methylase UbiE
MLMTPLTPAQDDFRRWNEDMARRFDPENYHLRSSFLIRWIARQRVKAITSLLKAQPGERVLEVGCGAGNILEAIGHGRLVGIDISTFMVQKSRQRLRNLQAAVLLSDAVALPFANRSFDKIICTEVLEHVLYPEQVVSEIARVATEAGVVIVSVPNEPFINRIKRLMMRLSLGRLLAGKSYQPAEHMEDEWHLHVFDLGKLRQTVQGKLNIVRVKSIVTHWFPLLYVVACTVSNSVCPLAAASIASGDPPRPADGERSKWRSIESEEQV